MNPDMHDDDRPVDALSARERLRSGTVETPPPDNRRTRRAATILFLLASSGSPASVTRSWTAPTGPVSPSD